MSDKIEEIRARHERDIRWGDMWQQHRDRATLLAEVDRLRAEIDGLQEGLALMKSGFEILYRSMGDKP